MVEDNDSSFGTAVRAFKFDGDELKFRVWESRTLALAEAKGFLTALVTKVSEPGLTTEQYEDGEVVEVISPSSEGILSVPSRVCPCAQKEIC